MDGDGDIDVLTANGFQASITLMRNDGAGAFRLDRHIGNLGYLNTIAAGDLDNDDDRDVVTADFRSNRIFVLLNNGDGTLGEPAVYRSGQAPFFVTTADLDGDGFRDVISADEGSRTVTVFRNRGDGTLAIGESIPAQGRAWCVAPTDLDRDGDLDLAVANQTPGSVLLLENIGDARYDAAAAVSIRVPGASYVAAADLDGDGDVDLAVSTWTRRRVAVLENTGRGTFRTPVEYDIGRTAYSLEIADMDGDGFLDLVTSDRDDNSVTVVLNQGDGTFFRGSHLPTGGEPRFSMTGDLDGDGVVDVVAANHDTWDLTVHLNVLPAPFDGNFVERICTVEEMRKVSVVPVRAGRVELAGKYIAPVAGIAGAPIDRPLYQNVRRFPLHEEFLRQVFPEVRFQSAEEYDRLVGRRATRRYWVGSILRLRTEIGIVHAFTAFADTGNSLAEALSLDEVREIHDALSASFELRPFAYLPDTNAARREARGWENPGFPVLLDDEIVVTPPALEFEAYTQAVWYGRVLLLERDAFDAANEIGRFSFQDIVVLSFAPRDIEGVVGGVITSETQVPLSHLSVRTARRGIPNAFVRDALERFLPFEGELVRLEVREDGFDVTPATPAEAEAFWSANRPRLGTTPQVDRVHRSLDDLLEIDVGGGGVPPEARYGGKAVNFARLQQLLEGGPFERYRESGFAIPVVHSLEFMEENTIPSAVDPARTVTYREYVEEIDADPELQTSPARRFAALEALRDHAEEHGRVSRSLVLRAVAKIAEVFGSTTTTVRFRSSSNVEDLLDFNGAGLYESTSACAADEVDSDDAGPSRCDRLRRDERGVERALKRVWISLWTFRAYEERAFFQIPQRSAAMGVLVTRAFPDERANGVAFTGNPLDPVDRRYMVVVQRGETSVVSPPPDVVAERDFIGVLAGQTVLRARDQGSSLLPEGEHVLSDEELDELGALLHHVAERFPVELEGHQPDEVILDFEFKIERDGSLAVKQVRPFLHSAPFPPSPEFELAVPPGAGACGIFSDELVGRSLRQEYESKSAIRFLPGAIALPTRGNLLEVDLVEELVFGPQRETATPAGPGFVFSRRRRGAGDTTEYSFRFEQEFALADGRSLRLELGEGLDFTAIAEEPVERSITLDDGFLRADDTALLASVDGEPMTSYSSCSQDHLPLWSIEAELSDGATVSLRQRFIPFEELNGPDTGPASLVWARVELPGATQTVADYWRLIYRARNHNLTVRWGVVLDPAVELEGLERPIAVVELSAPDSTLDGTPISPASARYLDAEFEPLAELEVSAYTEERLPDEPQPLFRRGDSDGDGRVGLTDAVKTLDALFRGGDPPPCPDAADADDDGALRIADPIFTLNYLFLGGRAPPEPGADGCGVDPTGDELGCPGEGC